MKKMLIFLLSAAIILSAAGCGSTQQNGTDVLSSGNTDSEFPGMTVSIEEISTQDDTLQLHVLWRNKTPYNTIYGESYSIERLENGQWVGCEKNIENTIFIAIGYELQAGTEAAKTYSVSDLFDVTTPGTYRFKTSCHIYTSAEASTPCTLTAEFTVAPESQVEPLFQKPPAGTLLTSEGSYPLTLGGYNWTYQTSGDQAVTSIADQSQVPLPADSLKPVTLSSDAMESVYAYVPKTGSYAVTTSLGFLAKLYFEKVPTSLTYRCWSDSVWNQAGIQPEEVDYFREEPAFYAKPGNYIYEITAAWEDTGAGYYGTANYYVYICADIFCYSPAGEEHSHTPAAEPQTIAEPVTGYCGNTQTTLYIGQKEYTFRYGHSVTLTDILVNLDYNPDQVCRCRPEYTVDTEFGTGYGINLTQGYARCAQGQANLTQEQIDTIAQIIHWAETTNCQYLLVD